MTEEKNETEDFIITTSDIPIVPADAGGDDGKAVKPSDADEKEKAEESEKKPGENATAEDGKAEKQEAEKQKAKKQNRVQKRIDAVVREREDAKRRAEAAEKKLAALDKKNEQKSGQAKEPVESDFDTYDEYLTALDKFDLPKQAEPKKAEDKVASDTVKLTDAQRTAMAVLRERVKHDAEKYSDFESIALNPELSITGEMLEALAECDNPVKVMYHLGKNKDIADQIANKSPVQQMREIAKLDLATVMLPKPEKTTKAADPITPVRGSDAQEKSIQDMTFSEYETKMNKREKNSKDW
jgi:hypothetical protein